MRAARGRDPKLAIVGATGTVGARLVELIDERRFPYAELKLFASPDSSASSVESGDHDHPVVALADLSDLAAFDITFLAVPRAVAAPIVKARPGPLLIDLSGAARALANAPLVAPGLTERDKIAALAAAGVVAIAHPTAHALAAVLKALEVRAEFVAATIILGASSGGRETIRKLIEQSAELMNARLDLAEGEMQLAFNVFADSRTSPTAAEVSSQVAALLGYAPALVTFVAQAPTLHGTALVLSMPGKGTAARQKLKTSPGLLLVGGDGLEFRGVVDTVGEEAIVVRFHEQPAGIALWCLFDGARLVALSALWAAESSRSESGGSTLA
jgi:aspartate-semialdehyde dehydrogenase